MVVTWPSALVFLACEIRPLTSVYAVLVSAPDASFCDSGRPKASYVVVPVT